MADPSAIDPILANVAAIIATNDTIGTVSDIPHVFSEVTNRAQTVEKTLETARIKLENKIKQTRNQNSLGEVRVWYLEALDHKK
ncbi:hypothetical protein PFICI_00245 [Pestalotiopsis fici W106-1]|uniref:Uncharacterized protein n=1 Tax=Pestalotiopsis fici (strain W106-1 / CGMCC3.15140) TaxID=1229662 RepID=W3XLS3_PESFW|nr:uncharacterized protein PFICI_00245 [Pestalotiopsis fici W106-1]ETS86417.1 hypothetical protein PFICI_00245 [Pestalotiopsis fici W106-1]